MNIMNLKGLAILLVAFSFLGEVYAVNCDKNPAHRNCDTSEVTVAFTGEVHTFRTDRVSEKFIVTGTGMDTVAAATLGNSPASTISSTGPDTLEIPFNASTAFPTAGNVEFSLDGNFISLVYLDGPIIAPSGNCPCQADWDSNLGVSTGPCTEVTDGTQVSLSSYIDTGSKIFFVSTAFDPGPENSTNSFCATIEVDANLVAVPGGVSRQLPIGSSDNGYCYSYMEANFCSGPIVVYP